MYEEERIKAIQYCKYVDLILFPAPKKITMKFIEGNEIDYITGKINQPDDDVLKVTKTHKVKRMKRKSLSKMGTPQVFWTNPNDNPSNSYLIKPVKKGNSILKNLKIGRLISIFKKNKDEIILLHPNADDDYSEFDGDDENDREYVSSLNTSSLSNSLEEDEVKSSSIVIDTMDAREKVLGMEELVSMGYYLSFPFNKINSEDLVLRILQSRNVYYERSVKKGFSRSDLNLSAYDYLRMKLIIWCRKICPKKKLHMKKD